MLNPAKGMRLGEETAFQYIEKITKAVEKVGGVLILLWHPNHIIKDDWWNLYLRTLKYLKEKVTVHGTLKLENRNWKLGLHASVLFSPISTFQFQVSSRERLQEKNAWFGSARKVGGYPIQPQIHADGRG
jgi:hypothetical protein